MTLDTALGWFAGFVVVYFVVVNGGYLLVHLVSLVEGARQRRRHRWRPMFESSVQEFQPEIAVVVPAYNEAPVIADSVRSHLHVDYPEKQVVVVNDGSTDDTLEVLLEEFPLTRVDASYPYDLDTEAVRDVYVSSEEPLVVVDKENGGKADTLNAGVGYTEAELFCAVDADGIVERTALEDVVRPFMREPGTTVATGGSVRVANGCTVSDANVLTCRVTGQPLVDLQRIEYLRAFLSGRVGLSALKSLLIISGAFGLFRTQSVEEAGGYDSGSVTEDLELVVRLHRWLADEDRRYTMEFMPQPVVWTEVPESISQLGRQRRRWYRGLVDTLWRNRDAVGRRRYGAVGLVALPFFVVAEAFGPLIEGVGYLFLVVAFLMGLLAPAYFVAFLAAAVGLGVLLSWMSVYQEVRGFRRYRRNRDVVVLLFHGFLENVGYRQWRTLQAWRGMYEYLQGVEGWGEMVRTGFEVDSGDRG